eukprot:gene20037-30837_t
MNVNRRSVRQLCVQHEKFDLVKAQIKASRTTNSAAVKSILDNGYITDDILDKHRDLAGDTDVGQCCKGHLLACVSGRQKGHCETDPPAIVVCKACQKEVNLDAAYYHCKHCTYDLCSSCLAERELGEFWITEDLIGLLVGTGGSNLKRLQKKVPGVVYKIPDRPPGWCSLPVLVSWMLYD